MNAQEFERHFLQLIFRTNHKITPHFTAYQLGIPFDEAQTHLESLATRGVAVVEVDDAGVVHYEVQGVTRPSIAAAVVDNVGSSWAQQSPPSMPVSAPKGSMSKHFRIFLLTVVLCFLAFPLLRFGLLLVAGFGELIGIAAIVWLVFCFFDRSPNNSVSSQSFWE